MIGDRFKHDSGKTRLTLVPQEIIWAIAKVREHGCKVYGDSESWRKVETERYRDAAYRHWLKYLAEPNGMDEESGLPHLWHVACNISFLIELNAAAATEDIDSGESDRSKVTSFEELTIKACPLCGGEVEAYTGDHTIAKHILFVENILHCRRCGLELKRKTQIRCKSGGEEVIHDGYAEAVAAWNKRIGEEGLV